MRQSLFCSQPWTRTHTEPPNVTGEEKVHGTTGTRTQNLLHTVQALWPLSYRATRFICDIYGRSDKMSILEYQEFRTIINLIRNTNNNKIREMWGTLIIFAQNSFWAIENNSSSLDSVVRFVHKVTDFRISKFSQIISFCHSDINVILT